MSTTPSTTNGLYSQTTTSSRMNQVAQSHHVLPPKSRLMTGLAARSSNLPEAPDQKSIAKNSPMNTRLVPRSGCAITITQEISTTLPGLIRSTNEFGATLDYASTRGSIMATAILHNSRDPHNRHAPHSI